MSDLASRLDHLEQIEAIRRLKHAVYCGGVDRLVAGDPGGKSAISAHLADDVVGDWSGRDLMVGKAAVEAFLFEEVPSVLSYSQHRVMNDVIDIDGDTATASWYLDCPAVFRPGNMRKIHGSGIIIGRYQEHYVRQHGVWKWRRITALLDAVQVFEQNWSAAVQRERNR